VVHKQGLSRSDEGPTRHSRAVDERCLRHASVLVCSPSRLGKEGSKTLPTMNLILLLAADWVEREEDGEEAVSVVDEGEGGGRDGQGSSAVAAEDNCAPPSPPLQGTPQRSACRIVTGVVTLADARRVGHLRTVIRAVVGDTLKVGELNGLVGTAVVEGITPESFRLRVRLATLPPPPSPVTLILALPESTVFAQVLHQVTVLGVKTVYVIGAAGVPTTWWGAHILQRDSIAETLTLGLEQTIDTLLPAVHLRQDTARFMKSELPGLLASSRGLMLARQPGDEVKLDQCHQTTDPVTLLVGPAANFTLEEEQQFHELGFTSVSFGPRALHVTAAVHALVGRLTL
jgi:16S rRNA (uracil1498-N3)-methyltransferase